MPMPILETKLYMAPLRPEVVPRPALIERLGAGLQRKLTLVSAPAGSGKSTLVSAWLQGLDRTAAWLSLDEGDNAPVRFFAHLFAALGQVDGVRRSAQDLLQASPSPQPDALVAALINDIAGDAEPFVLVLDDYHTIHELAIHDAVGLLLDRQPPELHLVIVTRHDPPLPLSRLRARGQLTEIRQSDLRFRHDEAAVFLRQAMGLPLTDADIAALEERTEGWITGLQLAALSMQGRDEQSVAGFIEGFSGRHHFVLDYLTDEVLKRQPEALQRFLLHTSILERMSGPLCDALMEREEEAAAKRLAAGEAVTSSETLPRQTDGETLQQLDAANLFVVPLDDERNWYRYHNLFAELLRARLQETDADQVPGLHRRAAAWYEEHGFGPDAVHHALASGDDDLAADVVQRQIMQLATWSRLDVATLLGWLQALPEHVVRRRPWLWLFTFRAMFASGRLEESMRVLDELEQALPRQTDGETLQGDRSLPDAQRVLQLAAADRASLAATRGNVAVVEAFAKRYLAQAQEDDTTGRLRAVAAVGMAHYRSGNMAKARRAFREAIDLALAAKLPVVVVPFLCNLAEVQIAQGQLRQALETCQQAEQVGTLQGTRIASAGFVGVVKAHILYQQNDLQGAERNALDGLALLSRGGIAEQFGNIHAVLAQVRQAQGDQQGAQAAIEWAAQLAQGGVMPRLKHQVEAHQARIWLAQGQVQRAVEWARQYAQVGETLPRQSDGETLPRQTDGETLYLREFEDLTLAQVWLAEGRAERALAVLDGLLASARAAGRQGSAIEIQAARAVALQALRRVDEALAALEPALSLGQPEGYVRAFVDLGEPMRALLKRVASRGVAPAYVARLLAAYEMTTEAWAEQPTPAEQPLVEPLSERELEVLQLLAEGLSNKEIGQRLFISLPTVKSHTRNIYGKLGVHSRREAVGRAQALGMLP